MIFVFFVLNCFGQSFERDEFSEETLSILKEFKKKNRIEGLAFAIFTESDIIVQECIGKSTYGYKINDKTVFSIQSASKNITALAAMIAVEEGMLNLDSSISDYLPDFNVNSCFENNPEQKITLRMLLTHTSGLSHEAPIGNNYDYSPCSNEEHLKSIENTWLKLPVGSDYSYSNLGFDLIAKIIETKSGMEYNEYLKNKIFKPLGMNNTTIDNGEFINNDNKTEGTISSTKTKHYDIPLIGSGSVYTNLYDLIKYIRFQMNSEIIDSNQIIDKEYLYQMYKIRFNHYGFGTYIGKSDEILYINHNGSGYGYSATFIWFPEYAVATVLLINKQTNTFDVCDQIARNYIKRMKHEYKTDIFKEIEMLNADYFENPDLNDIVPVYHCSTDTVFKTNWEKYIGTYAFEFKGMEFKPIAKFALSIGYKPQKLTIYKENNTLKIKTGSNESVLREYIPGVFFTTNNDLVDFNNLTFQNVKIKK